MPSPPIQVFLTTIASQPALRQRQEYILRILQVKKIPFTSYDLASDENAKRLWKRKAPPDKQQLPGILVGETCPGSFAEFEEAVEFDELSSFLRLNDTWHEDEERPTLPQQPIGVPGAMTPLEMTPERLKPIIQQRAPSPLGPDAPKPVPVNKRKTVLLDAGEVFSGFGLQGEKVSENELADLVAELGLDGDEAGDLIKGLSGDDDVSSKGKIPALKLEKPTTAELEEEKKPSSSAAKELPTATFDKPTAKVDKPASIAKAGATSKPAAKPPTTTKATDTKEGEKANAKEESTTVSSKKPAVLKAEDTASKPAEKAEVVGGEKEQEKAVMEEKEQEDEGEKPSQAEAAKPEADEVDKPKTVEVEKPKAAEAEKPAEASKPSTESAEKAPSPVEGDAPAAPSKAETPSTKEAALPSDSTPAEAAPAKAEAPAEDAASKKDAMPAEKPAAGEAATTMEGALVEATSPSQKILDVGNDEKSEKPVAAAAEEASAKAEAAPEASTSKPSTDSKKSMPTSPSTKSTDASSRKSGIPRLATPKKKAVPLPSPDATDSLDLPPLPTKASSENLTVKESAPRPPRTPSPSSRAAASNPTTPPPKENPRSPKSPMRSIPGLSVKKPSALTIKKKKSAEPPKPAVEQRPRAGLDLGHRE